MASLSAATPSAAGPAPPPAVSVLLPVYNGGPFLREAVACILGQSFGDFELIAIDDGSRDDSLAVLRSFDDPRLRVLRQENRGLAATLNRAIALARGEFLARQDQDDVSLPRRLERQVAFLRAHADCVMVGTWSRILSGDVDDGRVHRHPVDDLSLRWELLFNNPFVHSSTMLRKSAVQGVGGYSTDQTRQPPEDYELWSRLVRIGRVANLGEFLHVYREVPQSMSRDRLNPFLEKLVRISAENLAWAAGRARSDDEMCLSLAARVHGCPERVSRAFDRRAALELLEAAAERLGSDAAERTRLRTLARQRVGGLFPSPASGLRAKAALWTAQVLGRFRR